jgi:glycerophosphoryl diester phosphodiesterase
VIGHRGAAATHPENTLQSFRAAHDAGAHWVEMDVRLAADGAPVVIHDPTLERVAGCRSRAASLTSAALAAHGVPTLDQALALCASLGLGVNVEMKNCGRRNAALAIAVAAAIRHADPAPAVLVSSFRPSLLAALRAAAPEIPRGLLLSRLRPGWRLKLRALRPAALVCGAHHLTERDAAALKATGLPLAVYTVNDAAAARRLWGWGVDAVITDDPARLVQALSLPRHAPA